MRRNCTTTIKEFRNGNCVVFSKDPCFYIVKVYIKNELHDRMSCDDYRNARHYYKAFSAIAKNYKDFA
jgi:hypothetical protein